MTTVLVVAAHPDDAEIAMGMRIRDYVLAGTAVRVHCLTTGAPDPDGSAPRRLESLRAGAVLGVAGYTFSRIPDTRFVEHRRAIRDEVASVIDRVSPDIVYTHAPDDQHLDHRVAGEDATSVALGHTLAVTHFRSPYSVGFQPNLFFLGTEELMEAKMKALSCYVSQTQFDMDVFRRLSAVSHRQFVHHRVLHAFDLAMPYAEAFRVVRRLEFSGRPGTAGVHGARPARRVTSSGVG